VERIFIEAKTRPVGAPSPRALVPAFLVHLALLPFALFSFNPPLFEDAPPTVVEIAFFEEPEPEPEPEAEPEPREDIVPVPDPEPVVPDTAPAAPPVVAVPDVNLPQAGTRSAEERGAAEALSNYLCIFPEGDERARAECEAQRQTRTLSSAAGDAPIEGNLFTRMAVSLGLTLDPSKVPAVENPAIDPYAPNDTSYENPINDIRDPIPGVIHN